MAGFGLVVSFEALPGKADDICEALKEGARLMAAGGCRIHLTSRDKSAPDKIWCVEFWDSAEQHDAALAQPAAAAVADQVRALTKVWGEAAYMDLVGGVGMGPT
jgi:quinol monooxygenase YgiN